MFGRDHYTLGVCCPGCGRGAVVKVSNDARSRETSFEVDAMPDVFALIDGGSFARDRVKMRCNCGSVFFPWRATAPLEVASSMD